MNELVYTAAGILVGALVVVFFLKRRTGDIHRSSAPATAHDVQQLGKKIDEYANRPIVRPLAQVREAAPPDPTRTDASERAIMPQLEALEALVTELQKVQRTTVNKLNDVHELLIKKIDAPTPRAVAGHPPDPRVTFASGGGPASSAHASVSGRPALASTSTAPVESSIGPLVARWNNISWPYSSSDGIKKLKADLHNLRGGWQLSPPFNHRYWLVHSLEQAPMYLFPALGKDVSFFTDGFFELPQSGDTQELIEAAEVRLKEERADLAEEVAKLMHDASPYAPADVFAVVKRGRVA